MKLEKDRKKEKESLTIFEKMKRNLPTVQIPLHGSSIHISEIFDCFFLLFCFFCFFTFFHLTTKMTLKTRRTIFGVIKSFYFPEKFRVKFYFLFFYCFFVFENLVYCKYTCYEKNLSV
jgi:hypothetical protein